MSGIEVRALNAFSLLVVIRTLIMEYSILFISEKTGD